ncbi:N-acetylmuramoyl-L-alanine amidase [Phycicoccus sp. HDW14]|uniref:N-acetylmuramoyl-L-alanine amidase n=1 Tax=Phycicoccus sp. HDW14 TaxID=2714941 RepID=UPI00140D209C|nr:peptidoglycan recognition family protein [Phycicoccus sp. HDW14]QIM20531.1 N-acetylmuramoyl-L-alanine amidase [Phycicoccus sp. HDW14]QIM22879.1 N-acetylmuramoyl-L-alanine amidase [Phycicoccus sp. HDW14]
MSLSIPKWLADAGVTKAIPSTRYTKVGGRRIRLIVLHFAVTPETASAAEGVAKYFQSGVKASSHFTTDNDSTVFQVPLEDVAWAAPGANHDGIQIEQAGTTQTREQWLDPYSLAMLDRTARLVVALAQHEGIPMVHLTDAQLAAGKAGIVDHWAVNRVYKRSDHTDCGAQFPWDHFMARVAYFAGTNHQEDDMPITDKVVPSAMLGKNEPAVAIPRALDLIMRWSLEARDNAIQARKIAEAQALKGGALTEDEVKAAVREALSEAAQIEVVVRPQEVTP